jgi:hypothetical protein
MPIESEENFFFTKNKQVFKLSNNTEEEDLDENEKTIDEEIYECEKVLSELPFYFEKIWENVIDPYRQNLDHNLLNKTDKYKFINFMMKHNKIQKKLVNYLEQLKNCG